MANLFCKVQGVRILYLLLQCAESVHLCVQDTVCDMETAPYPLDPLPVAMDIVIGMTRSAYQNVGWVSAWTLCFR